MIKFLMVDIDSVTSKVPRSNFLETDLDFLADSILEADGILKPLLLKKTGFEKYEVIDGHLEYYAAVRTKEKNPDKGEMVNALIIPAENEEAVIKQTEAWKQLASPLQEPIISSTTTNSDSRITNIELRLEKQSNELRLDLTREVQRLEDKLKQIESNIPKRIEPLDLLNTCSQDDLAIKMKRSRVNGSEKIAKAIVDSRRKKKQQKFENYRDVVESVKGLGEKTILIIIDSWSHTS